MRGKRLKRIVYSLLALALAVMLLRKFEHSQVYHPEREMMSHPGDLGRLFEDVYFQAEDGTKLNGWYYPAAKDSLREQFALLWCHGNGGNISGRRPYHEAALATGVNLFSFDYRGYGLSEGTPGEPGTYRDTHAAYEWLIKKGFAPTNIIVMGESLGGGIGSELAATKPTGGLILQSSYTSVPDLGAEIFPWLPVRLISTIKYDTYHRLPKIKVPVMVMHSRLDTIIPYHHAEKNFAAANEPKLFWELYGDHNDTILTDGPRYIEGLNQFLKHIETQRQAQRDK